MHGRHLACVAIVAAILSVGASQARAELRGVIELFTSQGCSSCPPADELLGGLARDSSLIALSMPIDYWDYLGWKDTLAKPRHGLRQRGYAKVRGDREVYTPQVVVNGSLQAPGSDAAAIERAVAASRKNALVLSVPVAVKTIAGKIQVNVGAGAAPQGEVWLCPVSKSVSVTVGRGENSGRTFTYSNVVRRWIKLGDWTGAPQSFGFAVSDLGPEPADAVAVLVQAGTIERPGPMLGAAFAAVEP